MIDWVELSLSILVFIFYLFSVVVLLVSRRKISGSLKVTINWVLLAVMTLVIVRIISIAELSGIFYMKYLQGGIVLLFSIFLLISAFKFFMTLKKVEKNIP